MDLLYANEAPGAHPRSWHVESAPPFPDQPPLRGEAKADVCVIGAGYTGLSAALHLAQRGASVIVLEAQRTGWGASGRNGGQVGVGQRVEQPKLERMTDPDTSRAAWEIGRDAAALVRELVAEHEIPCALKPGVMHVNHRARFDEDARRYVEHMAKTYGHDAEYLDPDEVAARLGASGVSAGVLEPSGAHLHPLAYARGLARAALEAGAVIHERSQALEIDGTTVRTAEGAVRARQVIVAANGYLGRLLPEVAGRVMPINNFVLATEPLGEGMARTLIRDDVAVSDSRFVVNYYRLSEDRRMLFGGGESYGWRFPRDLKSFVRRRMLRVFPQLEEAQVTHVWGGTLAITPTRLPVWGEIRPGVFNASGYSGSGVALATMAGAILSEALAGERRRLEVMARLPTPRFPGGPALRRPTLIAAMLLARLRDAL
ncbi:MAG: NAD(P)/FAD-dependent oxidoreductase [Pseudomonadota bacterium]